jgi:hypothetical protein
MTSTSRRPRRALPQERPQMNAHINHLVGPPIGGHEFSLPLFEGIVFYDMFMFYLTNFKA